MLSCDSMLRHDPEPLLTIFFEVKVMLSVNWAHLPLGFNKLSLERSDFFNLGIRESESALRCESHVFNFGATERGTNCEAYMSGLVCIFS